VLAVEVGSGRLGRLLGVPHPTGQPARVVPGLAVASVEPEAVLGEFVHGVLRFALLARRLLESTTFQVLAAAAPGLPEFLVLHRIVGWLETRRFGRPVWDLVVLDAPASGHSLPLLAAPRTLGALARLGPIGDLLGRMDRVLADPAATLVCLVTTPEDLAVRETVELHRELADRLRLPVGPPIVNAVPPRRFGSADVATLARLDASHPHVAAARFHIERRRQAEAQVAVLRKALGVAPVRLPFRFAPPESPEGLADLAADLAAASGLAA
jgi:anion-transporting  ArsA/GET3 family ATPase